MTTTTIGRRATHRSTEKPKRLVAATVAVAFAAAGTERIDLFRGAGPFVLTPFIALIPILPFAIAATRSVLRRSRPEPRGYESVLPNIGAIQIASWILAIAVLISIDASSSPKSLSRSVLLVLLIVGALASVYLGRSPGLGAAVRAGAGAGLCIYGLFDIYQWLTYQTYGQLGPKYSFQGFLNESIVPYGQSAVRLTGGSLDPNRGSVVIAFYTYILLADPEISRTSRVRTSMAILGTSTAMVLLTYSRSGLLVYTLLMLPSLRQIWKRQTDLQRTSSLAASIAIIAYLIQSGALSGISEVFSSRLSGGSGSSTEVHYELYSTAFGLIRDNPLILLHGIGYGASYLYLGEYFPGNEYANFHSMYLTCLVEGGIPLLLAALAILVPPAISGSRKTLAISLLLFGIFYQGLSDPIFWLEVALLHGRNKMKMVHRPSPALLTHPLHKTGRTAVADDLTGHH